MEKKTTQRIIGILVAIALIIILLPLLYSRSDVVKQTASLSEPSFPEPQISQSHTESQPAEQMGPTTSTDHSIAENTNPKSNAKDEPLANSSQQPSNANASEHTLSQGQQPTNNNSPDQASASSIQKSMITKPEEQIVVQNQPETPTTPQEPEQPKYSIISNPDESIVSEKKQSANNSIEPDVNSNSDGVTTNKKPKKQKHLEKQVRAASVNSSDKIGVQLKKMVWVVQLGSFKDKNNARRLADKLRSAGYKAFMREVKSARGSSSQTRVFIGPEIKQASAVKLSVKLEQQMNLRGLVVMYKPFEL